VAGIKGRLGGEEDRELGVSVRWGVSRRAKDRRHAMQEPNICLPGRQGKGRCLDAIGKKEEGQRG